MKKKTARIGIDARFYGPVGKGLGRYTQEVVDNIIKLDPESEFVIFLRRDNFAAFTSDNPRVKKVLADTAWYSLAEQIKMPWLIAKAKLDLMHFPHFNVPFFCPTRFVVTIHDLILTKYPTVRATTLSPWLYWLKNLAYRAVIRLAVWRAKKIIAVSDFTKNDIARHFKIKPAKIKVIYEGVANLSKGRDSLFAVTAADKESLLRYNITKPFLLYVGNAYPHKNLERLLEVFNRLAGFGCDWQLVLVGKEDYFYEQLKQTATKRGWWQPEAKRRIIFTGYVTDAELEILFLQALLYVFPSLYEGFGLPPLEAMAKGCPVASSNRSSMPEILGEAALYFDPEDEEAMAECLKRLGNDRQLRQDLIKRGYEQIKKYNWWECARATRQIYQQALELL